MAAYNVLFNLIERSGYWDNHAENHRFVISPDVCVLNVNEQNQLYDISQSVFALVTGMDKLLCTPSDGGKLDAIFGSGIPRSYRKIQCLRHELPVIIKVDLVQDANGHFWIIEIDPINKHGWGLTLLINKLRDVIAPNARILPSIIQELSSSILSSEFYKGTLTLVSASHEHFYLPEFYILKEELEKLKIRLLIIEEPVHAHNLAVLSIDFPFFFRSSKEEVEHISQEYVLHERTFLLPPKPFLSSKALLSLVRTDGAGHEVHDRLKSYVNKDVLRRVQAHLPQTFLVDYRKGEYEPFWIEYAKSHHCVVKACISSGAKEVCFSDEDGYCEMLKTACQSRFTYVLQHEVMGAQRKLRYFDASGQVAENDFYCRFTAYCSVSGLVDLRVVARVTKKVHGAPDAIQLGVILE